MKNIFRNKIIIILSIFFILLLTLFFIFIPKNNTINTFSKEYLDSKGHQKTIPEYSSENSIAYNNKNGTKTLYLFTSPIAFYKDNELHFTDTKIKKTFDFNMIKKGYKYTVSNNDINTFYPKKLSQKNGILIKKNYYTYEFGTLTSSSKSSLKNINNFINDKKTAVKYKTANETLYFYPTSAGTNLELTFNKVPSSSSFSLWLKIPDSEIYIQKEQGGYLTLNKTKKDGTSDIVAVIQAPILKSKNNEFSVLNNINYIKKSDQLYYINFSLDNNIIKNMSSLFISFEMRKENYSDLGIYSKYPNLQNIYLSNYHILGNNNIFGTGQIISRYRHLKLYNLYTANIQKVYLHMYSLTLNNDTLQIDQLNDGWCAVTANWNSNLKTGDKLSSSILSDHEIKFDITEAFKKWINDDSGTLEENGFLIKSYAKNNNYNIILSNDNSLYNNRLEIVFN